MIWLLALLLLMVIASTAAVLAALRRQQEAHLAVLKQQAGETDAKIQLLRDEWSRSLGQLIQTQTGALQTAQRDMGTAVREIHVQLKGVEEQNKRLLEASREIVSLQDLLKPPKLRGGIGETLLGHLLEQVLPQGRGRFFTEQYRFKDGRQVDAVIHVGERHVCVTPSFRWSTSACCSRRRGRRPSGAPGATFWPA